MAQVLVYVAPAHRDPFTAVLAFDEQLHALTTGSDPEPRLAKLAWWQQEIDRLANGEATHPVTNALAALGAGGALTEPMQKAVHASARETGNMRFESTDALLEHAALRQGSIQRLLGMTLCAPEPPSDNLNRLAEAVGQSGWLTSMLSGEGSADASIVAERSALAVIAREGYDTALAGLTDEPETVRVPFAVQAALGTFMLELMTRQPEHIGTVKLPALRSTWHAWRAARRMR